MCDKRVAGIGRVVEENAEHGACEIDERRQIRRQRWPRRQKAGCGDTRKAAKV